MASYYTKQKGISYRAYTGGGSALDEEAWYAAQDANYLKTALAEYQKQYSPSFDPFTKFLENDALERAQNSVNRIAIYMGMLGDSSGTAQANAAARVRNVNKIQNYIDLNRQGKLSDAQKNQALADFDNMSFGIKDKYAADYIVEYTKQLNDELEKWNDAHLFYNKVVSENERYKNILAKEAQERELAEKKRQLILKNENEAKMAGRKGGHKVQAELFRDAAEMMYGGQAEKPEVSSGITPGVAGEGLTMAKTNVTGGNLGGGSGAADTPVSRREKARKGLLGGGA